MKAKDIFVALLVITIWGISFPIVKLGLEEIPPILFIALRFLIVAIPAVFFVPFPKTSIWNVIAVGVLIGIIKFGLLFIAMQDNANAGTASLILQAQVFFTILLSYILFKEGIKGAQSVGIMLAIAGFLLFFTSAEGNITTLGLILILGAALAWAFANVVMKRMKGVNLLHFMVWVSLVPPLPLLIISAAFETSHPITIVRELSPGGWFAIAYMGYLSTLIAYALWGYLLNEYNAATITPFALLIPVVGIFTATIFLKETLTNMEIIGAGFVMVGLVLCNMGAQLMRIWKNWHRT